MAATGPVWAADVSFLTDYNFVRDSAGNMYFADRGRETVIKKRSPDGKISTQAGAHFRAVQQMTVTPDGTLFLMDGRDLRRVLPDGTVSTVATKVSEHKTPPVTLSPPRSSNFGALRGSLGFLPAY